MKDHYYYMLRRLEFSKNATEEGESPFGSLVEKDGIVLGEAHEIGRQLKDITSKLRRVQFLTLLKISVHVRMQHSILTLSLVCFVSLLSVILK